MFEIADTGTLFLDEIGEMPALLQAALRVIEERAVRRLGSRKEIDVDVRLLAATNRPPQMPFPKANSAAICSTVSTSSAFIFPAAHERKKTCHCSHNTWSRNCREARTPGTFSEPRSSKRFSFIPGRAMSANFRNVIERGGLICSGEQVERHHFAPYPIEQRERLRNEDTPSLYGTRRSKRSSDR